MRKEKDNQFKSENILIRKITDSNNKIFFLFLFCGWETVSKGFWWWESADEIIIILRVGRMRPASSIHAHQLINYDDHYWFSFFFIYVKDFASYLMASVFCLLIPPLCLLVGYYFSFLCLQGQQQPLKTKIKSFIGSAPELKEVICFSGLVVRW